VKLLEAVIRFAEVRGRAERENPMLNIAIKRVII
jgi:hypothetical protein